MWLDAHDRHRSPSAIQGSNRHGHGKAAGENLKPKLRGPASTPNPEKEQLSKVANKANGATEAATHMMSVLRAAVAKPPQPEFNPSEHPQTAQNAQNPS